MESYRYFPILRTKDAELKGYEALSERTTDGLLPIFELTRGRRTKKDAVGDVSKKMERIVELANDKRFILDLTTDPRTSNQQIDRMLHASQNGFEEWRNFLAGLNPEQCIPMIHFNPNALIEVRREINELLKKHPHLAFRINSDNPRFSDYVTQVLNYIREPKNLILIVDAGFVKKSAIASAQESLTALIKTLRAFPNKICAISGFPASVTSYGLDHHGNFELSEVEIGDHLISNAGLTAYCDYSSIHPVPIEAFGGWVPRVDLPLDGRCFYYRYRQEDGGYERAAKEVRDDNQFKALPGNNWGISQIESAAAGEPEGLSPAHWIAVRVNIHITRQSRRVRGLTGIRL